MNVVTGGMGFIGNELVRQLATSSDVLIADNRNRIAPRIEDIDKVPAFDVDICDYDGLKRLFFEFGAKTVFHLAAIHYIPECNENPERTTRVNVEGTLAALRAAHDAGVQHFLLASSGAVYADSPYPLDENARVAPVDIYGWTKLFCEQLAMWHSQNSKMKITVCRLFNNYGPRETNAHIIPEIISQLRRGDILSLGNIKPRRDYIHTCDCAKALRLLAERFSENPITVNVASGNDASVEQLIAIIGEELGRNLVVETDAKRFRKADKLVQIAKIDRLTAETNWSPEIGFREGIRDLLNFEGLL